MARSHHRKKHKEQLRQFKHSHDSAASSPTAKKGKVTAIFTLLGAAAGFAVSYFATSANDIIWILIGVVTGGTAGYYTGRKIDIDK